MPFTRQTAALGLSDSPAGLAARIVQKIRDCDGDGDVERRLTTQEILTDLTLYWLIGTGSTQMTTGGWQRQPPVVNMRGMEKTPAQEESFDRLREVRAEALRHARLAQELATKRRNMIRQIIEDGFFQADVARELGVTRQAVQKMMAV